MKTLTLILTVVTVVLSQGNNISVLGSWKGLSSENRIEFTGKKAVVYNSSNKIIEIMNYSVKTGTLGAYFIMNVKNDTLRIQHIVGSTPYKFIKENKTVSIF